jgi:hypothetical protein
MRKILTAHRIIVWSLAFALAFFPPITSVRVASAWSPQIKATVLDYRQPAPVSGGGTTTLFGPHTFSGTNFAPGADGKSHRMSFHIPSGCGTQVRVTVHGGFSTGTIYDHVSIGIGNGTFNDTTATPVELVWVGTGGPAHGITVAAGVNSFPSDWATLSCTSSNVLIGIVDINASGGNVDSDATATDNTSATIFEVTATGGTYNVATEGGGTGAHNGLWGISKIETQ